MKVCFFSANLKRKSMCDGQSVQVSAIGCNVYTVEILIRLWLSSCFPTFAFLLMFAVFSSIINVCLSLIDNFFLFLLIADPLYLRVESKIARSVFSYWVTGADLTKRVLRRQDYGSLTSPRLMPPTTPRPLPSVRLPEGWRSLMSSPAAGERRAFIPISPFSLQPLALHSQTQMAWQISGRDRLENRVCVYVRRRAPLSARRGSWLLCMCPRCEVRGGPPFTSCIWAPAHTLLLRRGVLLWW